MIYYFLFILLVSSCLGANEQNDNIQILNYFESISVEEREEIKLFFKNLFFEQAFAYSLFGDKPMSLSRETLNEYSSKELVELLAINGYCQSMLEPFCDPSNILKKRWEIWKKHQSKFKIKKYLLLEKEINNQIYLVLINEKAFKTVVNQNIGLFHKIIDDQLSSDKLLENIKNENKNILDILHNNEGLLGILLGFGRHNSIIFQKREELLRSLGKDLKNPELIQEKIRKLDSRLQSLHAHDPYIIATINRVGFAADPSHPETIQLRNKYDELNKKINEIYSRDDWFEQTLLQLTSD